MNSKYNLILYREPRGVSQCLIPKEKYSKFGTKCGQGVKSAKQLRLGSVQHRKNLKPESRNSVDSIKFESAEGEQYRVRSERLTFRQKKKPVHKNMVQKLAAHPQKLEEILAYIIKSLEELKQSMNTLRNFIHSDLSVTIKKISQIITNSISSPQTSELKAYKLEKTPTIDSETEEVKIQPIFVTIPPRIEPRQNLLKMCGFNFLDEQQLFMKKSIDVSFSPQHKNNKLMEQEKKRLINTKKDSNQVINLAKKYIDSIKSITKKMADARTNNKSFDDKQDDKTFDTHSRNKIQNLS